MLYRNEIAMGFVPPIHVQPATCSNCDHCDGCDAPFCSWALNNASRDILNSLSLSDCCFYFRPRLSTCAEIFPTWSDADYWLNKLIEESTYGCKVSKLDSSVLSVSLMQEPQIPAYSLYAPVYLIDTFPVEYIWLVRKIIDDVTLDYVPPALLSVPVLFEGFSHSCLVDAVRKTITDHLDRLTSSGICPTFKDALRNAFGLGLMRDVKISFHLKPVGGIFEYFNWLI